MTWRVGPAGPLTWHAGPPHGCDAVLRPRGKAAAGPREAQEAHRARTRGRRPHVSMRPRGRLCGEPRGRRGRRVKGPRVIGPWTRGAMRGVRFNREGERLIDRVDPSPGDHQSRHVLNWRIK